VQRPPVVATYRRWKIIGMAPPSSGGGLVAEVLNVLAPYRPRALGHNTSTYLHVLTESLKAAFADRARWYGDPDYVRVPLERLLSAEHASKIRARISAVSAVPSEAHGASAQTLDAGTAHISVVDAEGNAVAVTTSVNTPFGALVAVPGRDIVLNNTMDDFSARPGVPNAYGLIGSEANAIAPGKRPLSSMSPMIVLEANRVRLVAGGSGGPRIISATLQVMLNVLEFSMNVARAVKAPRIHHQWLPDVLEAEDGVAEPVRKSLARRGHRIERLTRGAAVQAVEVVTDREGRVVRAASDARKGGRAAAY
jgi:gamma-glutamyltranspeptidase/glutathione hydrolase